MDREKGVFRVKILEASGSEPVGPARGPAHGRAFNSGELHPRSGPPGPGPPRAHESDSPAQVNGTIRFSRSSAAATVTPGRRR